ncbi:MAG: tRNA 2-selenouridine(34) synthase MnmH, partial [Sulfuricella sp.]
MYCTNNDRGHNALAAEDLTLAQLARFDDIIDVRSPSEFRDDHIPGAVNFPVLNDEERARVGTIYKQTSAFDAKKIGAALVARNIAGHVEQHFSDQPKNWRPLVYCWRGGSRSGAMTHILNQIGWRAQQLKGGYKAYRTMVLATLQTLPGRFRYRVICGPTGSGKSRLLTALDELGAQVLDLEGLAAHRGSILGSLPDADQPSQKLFESRLWEALQKFDPDHPVYVEAESKKIGNIRAPDALLE